MHNTLFRSSHLFFYVGIGLVLFALVILPTKIRVNMQSPEWPDYEDFYVGRILAPAIGSYGLAILVLGIIEVSISKEILSIFGAFFLTIFFGLIYVWTGFIVLSAMYVGFDGLFWLPTFMFYLVPSITVTLALFIGVAKKEYLVRVLKKMSIKIAISIVIITLPLVYVTAFWQLLMPVWS